MKVLLVVPRYSSRWGAFYQFPLGLGYIASAIRSAGHELRVLNLNHESRTDESAILDTVREFSPQVCATGGLSVFINQIISILHYCRVGSPGAVNVVGGGVVSGAPDEILHIVDAEYGVVNEGEDTIQDLLTTLESGGDVSEVKGILYRDRSGEIIFSGDRATEYDLGAFAWPDYDALEFEHNIIHQRPLDNYFFHTQEDSKPRALDMITSRSCPFKCTFCFHPTGKTYRERPLDDFFAELDYVVARFRPNMVALIDELFSLRRDRLLELCDRIKPYGLKWMVQLHVRSVTEEVLRAMRDAGCTYISYGIESMSQDVLKSMEKKSKVDQIVQALELTRAASIGIQGNLLFGDSAETLETANESMAWWSRNRHLGVWLTPLHVFPGSPDHQEAVRIGLIKPEERISYVRNLPVDLNISRMNDCNLEMVRHLVYVYGSSLLRIAPTSEWTYAGVDGHRQAPLVKVTWSCGDCRKVNVYDDVIVEDEIVPSLRLTCRQCRSRWDVRNDARLARLGRLERTYYRTVQSKLKRLGRLVVRASRRPDLIPTYVRAKVNRHYPRMDESRVESHGTGVVRSIPVLLRIEPSRIALRDIGSRLASQPFDASLHVQFGEFLAGLGINGAAQAHLAQAKELGASEEKLKVLAEHLRLVPDHDPSREVFFISWSGDASPREFLELEEREDHKQLLTLLPS